MIAFGPDICRDFGSAAAKEWLETNGLGGYASSTIIGANTRRYHALLVATLNPPSQRTVLLSKLEETLAVGEEEYDLSSNQYPGVIHPQGHRLQSEFRLDPFPTFVYEAASGQTTRLEKTVAMCRGHNAVFVRYRLLAAPGSVSLILRPLVNCRDHHQLMRENQSFATTAEIGGARNLVTMRPYPWGPVLYLQCSNSYFEAWGDWYRNFEYLQESARGLDFREDLYSPGFFTCELVPGESRYFIASTEPPDQLDAPGSMEAERARRVAFSHPWQDAPEELRLLARAADSFLVKRASPEGAKEARGIIAGYHWFEEWGRDAMIGLPGLALVTGRHDVARSVLRTFAGWCREGLIPNRIATAAAEPDYNSADATLWMFWAASKYLDHTRDHSFVRDELLPILLDIISWHVRGTRYGIKAHDDGLLRVGLPGTQLTWMDAKVGDWVVTPRHGKPVEVNALWHHALRLVEALGATHAGPRADDVAESFCSRFWNPQVGYLSDVVDGDEPADSSLRPNQIFAVSLPYPILPVDQARQVVEAVRRDLLTPYGLRTLSPHDGRYHGRYLGDQRQRDGAYHQGTVWPWLLGPFITAHVGVSDDEQDARRQAKRWLEPFWRHLHDAGVGQVSEIFDGDPPHQPRGCIAQAWSVAEILRAAVEDLALL